MFCLILGKGRKYEKIVLILLHVALTCSSWQIKKHKQSLKSISLRPFENITELIINHSVVHFRVFPIYRASMLRKKGVFRLIVVVGLKTYSKNEIYIPIFFLIFFLLQPILQAQSDKKSYKKLIKTILDKKAESNWFGFFVTEKSVSYFLNSSEIETVLFSTSGLA